MESRDYIRPFLALLVGIGLVVLVIVLIVKAVSGGPSAPTSNINITNYDNSMSSATLLVDTPTNVDQDHRQMKIVVSGTQNTIDILQGYQGVVMSSNSYPSNTAAYGVFLQTLQLLNFSHGSLSNTSYEGYCPEGDRYLLSFNSGQGNLFTYWATSCGQGTYKGNLNVTLTQFSKQIPETQYDQLTGDLALGF